MPTPAPRQISLREHQLLGDYLDSTRDNLDRMAREFSRAYGSLSKPHRRAERAVKAINELKAALDSKVKQLFPQRGIRVYHPRSQTRRGKTIFYYSGWNSPHILWRVSRGGWLNQPMFRATPNEGWWYLEGIGLPGIPLEFIPNDPEGGWDNPGQVSRARYQMIPDVVWLKDGVVSDVRPPSFIT